MTTSKRCVLVISTAVDTATDEVIQRLSERRVAHFRINTEDYPFAGSLTARFGAGSDHESIEIDGHILPEASKIWYRRVRVPGIPNGMDADVYDYCIRETRAALIGSIGTLASDPARWMSEPAAVWRAEYKPLQLSLAERVGLSVPRTVVSNRPEAVVRAFRDFGSLIVKPVRSGHLRYSGAEYAIYTSRVLEEHLSEIERAKWAPAIYQELLPKKYDLRVTIVGDEIFAAAIDSQSDPDAAVDWRQTSNPNLPHRRVKLPDELEHRLITLLKSLNLNFGAIDLVQTPDDQYFFLEVNPSGQWLWLDDILDFRITDKVADWLARGE